MYVSEIRSSWGSPGKAIILYDRGTHVWRNGPPGSTNETRRVWYPGVHADQAQILISGWYGNMQPNPTITFRNAEIISVPIPTSPWQTVIPLPPRDTASLLLTVVDAETGAPVAGALVNFGGTQYHTDSDGQVYWESLGLGVYSLEVLAVGYEGKAVDLEVQEFKDYEVTVRMGPYDAYIPGEEEARFPLGWTLAFATLGVGLLIVGVRSKHRGG